ncbi:MAG: methylated-DNA--[protein]-cysteine S-methyltransferase [Anaerolineae bacterium]|nr:methylated-DNA--[protein]-cysteine S-methyltransferase [Anaerolineae bacterium]
MLLEYTSIPSPFGLILTAFSPAGLCFLGLWQDEDYLLADLRGRFPQAELIKHSGRFAATLERLSAYAAGHPDSFEDVAVDLGSGTPFQQTVWAGLRHVSYGQIRTYSELTASLGKPVTAVRAVAHGCATNPVSLVIPCHRILRNDGSLGGYYWGLERKRALLEMEGALKPQPRQSSLF